MAAQRKRLLAEETTGAIIGSFLDVHATFGFGYRELIYSLAMERDLVAKGHHVDREAEASPHDLRELLQAVQAVSGFRLCRFVVRLCPF